MKKQLIRTSPGFIENTDRTRKMRRPMRCHCCGITKDVSQFVRFARKRCVTCRAKEPRTKPVRVYCRDDR